MRAGLAATFAAALVGLSPAGALPYASFAAASAVCQSAGDVHRASRHGATGAANVATEWSCATPDFRGRAAIPAAAPAIWRSASGPAPSQAPPAPLA